MSPVAGVLGPLQGPVVLTPVIVRPRVGLAGVAAPGRRSLRRSRVFTTTTRCTTPSTATPARPTLGLTMTGVSTTVGPCTGQSTPATGDNRLTPLITAVATWSTEDCESETVTNSDVII